MSVIVSAALLSAEHARTQLGPLSPLMNNPALGVNYLFSLHSIQTQIQTQSKASKAQIRSVSTYLPTYPTKTQLKGSTGNFQPN